MRLPGEGKLSGSSPFLLIPIFPFFSRMPFAVYLQLTVSVATLLALSPLVSLPVPNTQLSPSGVPGSAQHQQ